MKTKLKAALLFIATMGISSMANSLDATTHYPFQPNVKSQSVEQTCNELEYVNSRLDYFTGIIGDINAEDYASLRNTLGAQYDEYIGVKFQKAIYENTILNFYFNNRGNAFQQKKSNALVSCSGVAI